MHILALGIGFLMDACIGDPRWLPHPVRMMGRCIGWAERLARRWGGDGKGRLLTAGFLMAVLLPALWGGACLLACRVCYRLDPALGLAIEGICCYQMLAMKDLRDESMCVYRALSQGTLAEAREAVSMIVGRDTERLDGDGVARAAVETVAENFPDGVLAPMLYMALLGAPGGYWYKCINTLDSMIGYKDPAYLWLGRFAAKLDDWVNFLPSRLAAFLMVICCPAAGLDWKGAWRIYLRDRKNHASPNSAQTEAAAAGALGIRLAGDAWYFGKRHEKPFIGDGLRPISPEDIRRVNRLMMLSSWLAMSLLMAVAFMIWHVWK